VIQFRFFRYILTGYLLVPFVYAETTLDTVSVHASRTHVSTSIHEQIITRDQFIHEFQDLSDLLQQAAGLQVRTSSPGNPASISIRGSTHKQVTVVIDDVVLNNAQTGDFDINQIPLSQIESIKVIQGANADAKGIQPIGGTIIITTVNPEAIKQSIQFSSETFNTQKLNLNLKGELYGSWMLNAEHYKTSADYTYPVPSPINNPNDKNREESIRNNEYTKDSAIIKWNTKIDGISILNKFHTSSDKKQLPNYQMNSPKNNAYISNDSHNYTLKADWNISKHWQSQHTFDVSRNTETYKDLSKHISLKPTYLEFETSSYSFIQDYQLSWGHSIMNFFISAQSEMFSEDDRLTNNATKCNISLSICDVKSDQNQFIYKVGYKYFSTSFNFFSDLGVTTLDRKVVEKYGNQDVSKSDMEYSTWSANIQFLKWDDGLVSLSMSKGLRIPSLYELFGDRGLVKSNDQLSPEKSINSSIDIEFEAMTVFDGQLTPSSSLYFRRLNDAIVPIYSGSVGTYKNTNNADLIGWQVKFIYQKKPYSLGINTTLQSSQTESEYLSFDNNKLAGIYHKQLLAYGALTFLNNGKVYLSHEVASDLYLDQANNHKLETNQRTNLKLSWKQHRYIGSIQINNLFNNEYYDQYNRPIQDRSITFNNFYEF